MNVRSVVSRRSFFPTLRASLLAGVAVASLAVFASAQDPAQTPASTQTGAATTTTTTTVTTDANGKPVTSTGATVTFNNRGGKKKPDPNDKVVESKDTKKSEAATKKSLRDQHKVETLAGVDAGHPDKQLFDKAIIATNKGHFDVARLDLQTMLNTYPDSEYQMRAKLAIADSWYKEGGTAALTQAESEYADFRVFFPNQPEAAEAQMRIGDIYFRQMDRPDRDYAKALHAEEEYRRMLTDYPNSTLVPEAKQRLRDVQEVLATRESDIAAYYSTRDNYAAVIARYQTVADTYPLYSHMDDVLIGLGDAYEAQARYVRTNNNRNLTEDKKAELLQLYDGEAADMYRKVVLEHGAAAHVEDAKDRLAAMNLPIPTPTKEQMAASVALENSRSSYKITDYAKLFFLHVPDTVMASHTGEPPLTDPKATTAPMVIKKSGQDFMRVLLPGTAPAAAKPATTDAVAAAPAAAAPTAPAAPLSFEEVPTAAPNTNPTGTVMSAPLVSPSSMPVGGAGMSVEIMNSPKTTPAADPNNPLKPVKPATPAALPDAEAAAPAPDVPNQVTAATPAAQTPSADGKKPKVKTDKKEESGSTDKNKTGIEKIIPHW